MRRGALALVGLLGFAGCGAKFPLGLFCEGGVERGASLGGECLAIDAELIDADPAAIGRATWVSDFTRPLSVRRAGSHAYSLHLDGKVVGSITRDGNRLHVHFGRAKTQSGVAVDHTFHLRSDAPGWLN